MGHFEVNGTKKPRLKWEEFWVGKKNLIYFLRGDNPCRTAFGTRNSG